MSVTYLDLLRSLDLACSEAGAQLITRDGPPQKHSGKAPAGSGKRFLATVQALDLDQSRGGKPEHGGSLTTGTLTLVLYPSSASESVTMEAAAELLTVGHCCILQLDGKAGIRAEVKGASFSAQRVTVRASLSLALACSSLETPASLVALQ